MRTVYIILSLFVVFLSSAQTQFPIYGDSAKWNVEECVWTSCWNAAYSYEGDTILCGSKYSKVFVDRPDVYGYIRVEGKKVFCRRSVECDDKEYLMYDFSVRPGDTVFIGYQVNFGIGVDTIGLIADRIDTVQRNGRDLKRIKLKYNRCNDGGPQRDTMIWIEGVGATIHPFFSFKCLCDGCESRAELMCYRENSIEIYKRDINEDCDRVIISNTNNASLQNVNIYPNPFHEALYVEHDFESLEVGGIYTIEGRRIRADDEYVKGRARITPAERLVKGVYLVLLEIDEKREFVRIIKN